MTKKPILDFTLLEISDATKIVEGLLSALKSRSMTTVQERLTVMKMLKQAIGILKNPPKLAGGQKKDEAIEFTDLQILACEREFGTLPKAAKAFYEAGLVKLQSRTNPNGHASIAAHVKDLRRLKAKIAAARGGPLSGSKH